MKRSTTSTHFSKSEALKAFGHEVRKARKAIGFSQEELAAKVELSPDAISQMERGLAFASIETLLRMAQATDIRVSQFFEFEGSLHDPRIQKIIDLLGDKPPAVLDAAVAQISALIQLHSTFSERG